MESSLQRTGRSIQDIYAAQADRVYRVAYLYMKNRYDSEDVVQDVFVKLIGELRKGKVFKSGDHEKAWLIRVAVNLCLTDLRAESKHGELPLDENVAAAYGEEAYEVLDAVQTLPTPDRYAVYLYYYEGYGVREIGKLLKEPEGTISSRLSRARKKLRAILEGGNHGRQIQQRL